MKFTHILFPVDFSARCHAAAGFVLAMARHSGARVTLLHVIPAAIFPVDFNYGDAEANAIHRLDQFACNEFPLVKARCVVEIGDVAGEITACAERTGADLIAMPSHGGGAFRPTLLGSTTAKVLCDAQVPVWTAPHVPQAAHRPLVPARRILVVGGAAILSAAADLDAEIEIPPLDCGVRAAALEKRVDMVVTGRSKAYDVVRDAPCPVLRLNEAKEYAGIRAEHVPLGERERSVA